MVSNAPGKIRLVNEQRLHPGCPHGSWAVAENHACRIRYAFHRESKRGEPVQVAHLLVEPVERAQWEVFRAYELKFDACGSDARFGIRNAEDNNFMSPALESPRQCGHWIEMTRAGKTECSQSCHGMILSTCGGTHCGGTDHLRWGGRRLRGMDFGGDTGR